MATGPIETHLHRSFNWENGAPGPQEGPRGRSANCGNGLSAQSVRLRSEINLRNDDFTVSLVGIVPRTFAMPDESASSSLVERDELKENLLLAK